MKNKLLVIVLLVALLFTSCQKPKEQASDVIFIREEQLQNEESVIKNVSSISDSVKHSVAEAKIDETKELAFNGKTFLLRYDQTHQYLVGDVTADVYLIDGSETGKVVLLEDGTVYAFLDTLDKLEISPHASEEEAAQAIMQALADEIDFSYYDHWECTQSVPGGTETGFGYYSFMWYNEKGDCIVDDITRVGIFDTGAISAIWMKNRGHRISSDYNAAPRLEDHQAKIEKAVMDLNSDKYEITKYETNDLSLTKFDGNYCIDCSVSVFARNKTTGAEWGEAVHLLVPASGT